MQCHIGNIADMTPHDGNIANMTAILPKSTTMTPENADLSISTIYPDKHKALRTAGQLKENQEMQTLRAVLEDESWSGPLGLEKKSHQTDHCDTLFITKYANLSPNTRPINQVIKKLRNQYKLR